MVRGFFLFAATSLVSGLVAAEAPLACAVGCVEGIYRDPVRLGCTLGDKNCACHSGKNFEFGIRDCIEQACNWSGAILEAQTAAAQEYGAAGCLPFTSTDTPAPAATTPPPPPPAAAPATTPPAEKPAAPATSAAQNPAAPAQTPANNDGDASKPPASSEAPKPSPSPEAAGPSPSPKTSAAPKPEATTASPNQPTTATTATAATAATDAGLSSSASSTGAAVSAATASDAPESSGTANSQTAKAGDSGDDSSSGGLSVAAKAGIGAGAGVAVAMMAITACCVLMRRRAQNRPKPNAGPARPARSPMPNISRPIGGGRQYAEDIEAPPAAVTGFPAMAHVPSQNSSMSSPKPTFGHSDERYSVKGNRYEDMLPRTQPRTMI